MKKILIISDTHGSNKNMKDVIKKEKPFDVLIHLGDVEDDKDLVPELIDPDCELYMLKGNNDFFFDDLPNDLEIELGPHHVFLTHGHYFRVNYGVDNIVEEAQARGCDIAMFGHTHKPYFDTIYGITLINPGSLSYPRTKDRRCSYMVMEMDDEGNCSYHEYYIDD